MLVQIIMFSGLPNILASLGHTGRRVSGLGPHIKYTNTNKNWWAKQRFEVNLQFCVGPLS